LTGDLGRPQMFSPIRRSSLYFELVRFDMSQSPFNLLSLTSRNRTIQPFTECGRRFTGVQSQLRRPRQ
jgi:hypothetical protein